MVKNVNSEKEFDNILQASLGITVVDFWAEWCGPCKIYAPTFEKTDEELPDVEFIMVNIDKGQSIAVRYDIRSIPATLVFNRGELKGGIQGNIKKEDLIKVIEQAS